MNMSLRDMESAILALKKFKGIEARRASALVSIAKVRNFKYDKEVQSLLQEAKGLPGLLMEDEDLGPLYVSYKQRRPQDNGGQLSLSVLSDVEESPAIMPSEPVPETLGGSELQGTTEV